MKRIYCFLYFLLSGLIVFSQNIESAINAIATDYAQERVYLHYDKSNYVPGDTVWFKVYLKEGISPSFDSKTFYIDWTDDHGNLFNHTISPLDNAVTFGQVVIPDDYTGEFIHVKAYTKWMLNFDTSFLYEKDIRIISKNSKPVSNSYSPKPEIVFFPEGGDAVEGINNKIAFKATDQWGRPVKISGTIVNNRGKVLDSLRVIHDGMGYFFLFPGPGESFSAKWKDEKGKTYTTPLPAVKPNGLVLQVSSIKNKRIFFITADSLTASETKTIHILGTMNQHLVFSVVRDISEGLTQGTIPVGDLPSGILTITVFDGKWVPMAERITFINNEEYPFNVEMNVQHWGLNKRARNEIEIAVPDSLYASLSVAVTDAGIGSDSSNTIISQFLLSADLKGQVFNPSYYFSSTNEEVSKNLDLVMLTNGWRRFFWEEVVKGKMPQINYPRDTSYLTISGKVYGVTPTQLRDNASITLVVSNNKGSQQNEISKIPIRADGTFSDPAAIVFDTANVFYQLSKNINYASVEFMENKLPAFGHRVSARGLFFNQVADTSGYFRQFQLSDEWAALMKQFKGKTLETVILKAKTKDTLALIDEKYTSGLFAGGDSYQFDLLNDKRALSAMNIFSYLQGQVAGLQISNVTQEPTLQWRGGTPALYLDETLVNADLLSGISVSDVAYIKVMRPPFMGATGGGSNGAIAVYTKKGDDVKAEPGKGLSKNKIAGYSVIRQFYSPRYSSFGKADDWRDLRTTLYWNPQVMITPVNKKVLLTFYNNDVSRAFRVIIEGMSLDGRLVHMEQLME